MNTAILKSPTFIATMATAVIGTMISQHVFLEGTALTILGWMMQIGGLIGAGHTVGSAGSAATPTA